MTTTKPLRIKTPGGWYVETSAADWSAAIVRMQAACIARDVHMTAWQRENAPADSGYLPAEYWERYNAERASFDVDYPLPEGHVLFESVRKQRGVR